VVSVYRSLLSVIVLFADVSGVGVVSKAHFSLSRLLSMDLSSSLELLLPMSIPVEDATTIGLVLSTLSNLH
jgi:hypothetical protein